MSGGDQHVDTVGPEDRGDCRSELQGTTRPGPQKSGQLLAQPRHKVSTVNSALLNAWKVPVRTWRVYSPECGNGRKEHQGSPLPGMDEVQCLQGVGQPEVGQSFQLSPELQPGLPFGSAYQAWTQERKTG